MSLIVKVLTGFYYPREHGRAVHSLGEFRHAQLISTVLSYKIHTFQDNDLKNGSNIPHELFFLRYLLFTLRIIFFWKSMQWCSFTAEQNVSPIYLKARSWKCYIICKTNSGSTCEGKWWSTSWQENRNKTVKTFQTFTLLWPPSPTPTCARQLDQIKKPKRKLG